MIKNIRHTGIVIKDLEASLRFYRDMLGFQIITQMEECGDYIDKISLLDEARLTTVKMAAPDGQMIELLKYHSDAGEQRPRKICDIGIAHIAFTVADLSNEYNKLKKQGVPFNAPPQLSPDGYAKVTFCRAPEGTFIELVELLADGGL